MAGALEGLRVLDIATLYSAPLVAAMLGDLGADVIKIEPPVGDGLRKLGVKAGGRSMTWAATSYRGLPFGSCACTVTDSGL